MNLKDLQDHIGSKKATQLFKVMKSHLQANEITERAGFVVYNYEITYAINYFRDLARDKSRTKTDKQFHSYFDIQAYLKQMRDKGVA